MKYTNEKDLASDVAKVMSMWADWAVMYPMSMTESEFIESMQRHFIKFKKEMDAVARGRDENT